MRIIEVSLCQYQKTVEGLCERVNAYWMKNASRMPTKDDLTKPNVMREDLYTCQSHVNGFDDAIGALFEQMQPSSQSHTWQSLQNRTLRTVKEIRDSLSRCEHRIDTGLQSWGSFLDRYRAWSESKWTRFVAMIAPPGLVASFFGMNLSAPFSDLTQLCCVAGAFVVSAFLLVKLFYEKRKWEAQ